MAQSFMTENESLGRRGGVRRGRKFDPNLVCDLHARIQKETRLNLKGIATASKCTVGELIDRVIAVEMRRQTKKEA